MNILRLISLPFVEVPVMLRRKSVRQANLAGLTLSATLLCCALPASAMSPAELGRKAWLEYNCYSCHGMHAQGGMGPNVAHAEAGDISEVVRQGGEGGMPAYGSRVTATEISNLGAYLRTIGTPAEPTFTHWWENPPTR